MSVWFTRGHIRVTTVTDRLTPRQAIYFSVVFEVVSLIVLLTLSYGSYLYYIDTTTVGQVTGIPYSVMILAVLIGTFACSLISVAHIKQDLALLKHDDATLERLAKEANALTADSADQENISKAEAAAQNKPSDSDK